MVVGFWALGGKSAADITEGVGVVHRSDYNQYDASVKLRK